MAPTNLYLGVLQKIKFTDDMYTYKSNGYSIVDMDALSRHKCVVAVLYRVSPSFFVETLHKFRTNGIRFQLMMRE